MLRHFAIASLTAAVLLVVAGCRKPPPETVDPWAGYGFMRHIPSDAEGALILRRPLETWRGLAPSWQPLFETPALRESWQRTPAGRMSAAYLEAPATAPFLEALAEAAEQDVFAVLGSGTALQLAGLQQMKRLFEAARLRNLFTPQLPEEAAEEELPLEDLPDDLATAAFTEVIVPLPPAMQETLEKFVREATIPPLILGAEIPPDSALPRLLEQWVAGLPEKLPRDKVDAGPHGQFTRVRLPVTMLVPTNVAVRARDILAANIGDPYAATYIIRDLLAKVTTLGFGHMHGYFVVSIGSESGLPTLVTSPDKSLAGTPAMQRLQPLLGEKPAAFFYADPLVVSLAAAPPPVAEYLDAAMESALEFAPAEKIEALRDQADTLRAQATELFRPRVAAVGGIVQQTGPAWRAELFGGSFAPRLALGNAAPLMDAGDGVDFLWTETWEEGYARRWLDFAGGIASFASRWLEALGPVFLDEAQKARADGVLRFIDPPLQQLRNAAGKLIESALDPNVFLAASLDGAMPALSPAAGKAILPRLAAGAGLRDRDALSRGWQELASSSPGREAGWPEPVAKQEPDGSASYEYPVPFGGPDLGVAVTIANRRWILGNSSRFNAEVSALPVPTNGRVAVQSIGFNTRPLADFASVWSSALAEDPSLASVTGGLIPVDPPTLDALALILENPRRFRYDARWENDMLHRVIELAPAR